MKKPILAAYLLALTAFSGCGGGGEATPDAAPPMETDDDDDGVSVEAGDCNDNNPHIHPGAPDPCDGLDQNCDGEIDEAYDQDQDNITVCQGDCADNDPDTRPNAPEMLDGKDNDCDGTVDNHNEQYDDDGDGYSEDQGDCDDEEKFVNPGAVEVQLAEDGTAEGVDNNCNQEIDEAALTCDEDLDNEDPYAYAQAIGLCERVRDAVFEAPTDPRAREIRTGYGNTYVPREGEHMIALSSGIVADAQDPDYVIPESGTELSQSNVHDHPNPMGAIGCSDPDPAEVNDYAELRLELQVPTNAQSFSFDFNFMSSEYPEYVCSEFDDTFEAILESEAFEGNISFDSMGNPVSINVGFFTVCEPGSGSAGCTGVDELLGTGYESEIGGGTGWLTTTSPVVPGEKIVLRFIIFDEGDHILDSAVLIDNFRWQLEAVDEPITEG